jgi:N-acetyl-alpha-D-muramate 1-phosphate uridylyltransferase
MIPPVAILAGGLATRLYPVTRTIPKSLIEVEGHPFIDHQLSLLSEKGIICVILCVGQFGRMIEEYVGSGSRYGIDVKYSYDGDTLRGTGGAIKNAACLLPDEFIILYGDSYLDIDFRPVIDSFFTSGLPALMTVYHNQNKFDSSNIVVREGKVVKYEKNVRDIEMEYIDYGLIMINKKVFDEYPDDHPFDLTLVLSNLVRKGQVTAFEVHKRFYEIGSQQGILETGEYIRNRAHK